MTKSKYMTFSSCDLCQPKKWEIIGETKHAYRCLGCVKLRRKNLKLIDYKEKEEKKEDGK
jgi:hypothetical protein